MIEAKQMLIKQNQLSFSKKTLLRIELVWICIHIFYFNMTFLYGKDKIVEEK